MNAYDQMFIFGFPCRKIMDSVSSHPVHFFSRKIDGTVLLINNMQHSFFKKYVGIDLQPSITKITDLYTNDASKEFFKQILVNDSIIQHSNAPMFFCETAFSKKCLSIKTQLKDSTNQTIGIGGLAFYFHQLSLENIVDLINKLAILRSPNLPAMSYTYVAKTNILDLLSFREKECTYFLTRCMTDKEIARKMEISPRTVEIHIANIKNKLGCYKRSDIVDMVFELRS